MRIAKTLIRLGGCWTHSHVVVFVMSRLRCGHCICVSASSPYSSVASWILLRTSTFVLVGKVQTFPIASHLKGLEHSFEFCCQDPVITGIEEGRYDEHIRLTLEAIDMIFSLERAAVVTAILESISDLA